MHAFEVFIQVLRRIGPSKAYPAKTGLFIGRVSVINTGCGAITILKGVVHAHIIALHVLLYNKAFRMRSIESHFNAFF